MRLVRILASYFLGFLPLFGLLGFGEGAARGDWAFSRHDFVYQIGAYVAFWGGWLVISSVVVVPLLWLLLIWLDRRERPGATTLGSVLFGPLAVFVGAIAVQGGSALLEGTPFVPGMLLAYPLALLLAGGAFGWASASKWGRSRRSVPAAA
jgi:hypothetical protein